MLADKILNDYKQAMKDKDKIKSSTLSFLRSAMANALIDKRKDKLEDEDAVGIIKKQVKQHQDSIEQFKKGNRQDLVEKETKELEILKSYLPQELPRGEIEKIIDQVVAETQAQGPKDMGRVMKQLMPKISGKADNKLVSELVRAKLGAS